MMKVPLILLLAVAAGVPSGPGADDPPPPAAIEAAGLRQLLTIRRVYVDRLTGGETAAQMRDILISSLEGAKLFILTENQGARGRGAAGGLRGPGVHRGAHLVGRHQRARQSGRTNRRQHADFARRYRRRRRGENEADHSAERRHEAVAAVRLVNKDGDVIWSTTEESLGAKFHGASVDVADKITARLKEDFEKARKLK